jgi:hypothetical protein
LISNMNSFRSTKKILTTMSSKSEDVSRRQLISTLLLLQSTAMLAPKFAGASDTSFENVKLGKGESSLVVPPLGIGAWSWGDQGVWGYGGYDKEFTDASIEAAFQAAVKSGVTFFDTAEVIRGHLPAPPPDCDHIEIMNPTASAPETTPPFRRLCTDPSRRVTDPNPPPAAPHRSFCHSPPFPPGVWRGPLRGAPGPAPTRPPGGGPYRRRRRFQVLSGRPPHQPAPPEPAGGPHHGPRRQPPPPRR